MRHIHYILPILLIVFSCKTGTNDPTLPKISGAAGEIIVVMDNMNWEGVVGDTLRSCLAKPYPALPQLEPSFDLIHIIRTNLTDLFKLNRNLIFCDINKKHEKAEIKYQMNVWAKPQLVAYMSAPDKESFQSLINEKGERLYTILEDAERKRITQSFKANQDEGIYGALKQHDFLLTIPHNFRLDVNEKDFMWFTNEPQEYMQGIVIYEYPFTDGLNITKEHIIERQDEIGKKYIEGPIEGSYMQTEKRFETEYAEYILRKELYIASVRGLWKLENAFMGGPFINTTTIDSSRNKVIGIYAYAYAPNKEKRNLVRQLEAILMSLEILDNKE